MTTRIIKTSDGQEYSGGSSDFAEHDDYIEHKGFLSTTKIYKRVIARDTTISGTSDVLAALVAIIIMMFAAVIVLAPVISEEGPHEPTKHRSIR